MLDKFCKNDISKRDWFVVFIYNLIITLTTLYVFPVDMNMFDLKIIFLTPLVIITFIFHEYIHVFLFKLIGGREVHIEAIRDKEFKSVIMYQSNKDIKYSKLEVILILLAPAVLISILSILSLFVFEGLYILILINALLNLIGSSADFLVSFKVIFDFSKGSKFYYDYNKTDGVSINKEL